MTEKRKRQLDAVAERFHVEPRSVYLLAGEVEGALEYVPSNDGPRAQRQWQPKRRDASPEVDLDWIFS